MHITTTNRRGETVERKTEAFIDGSWYTIARDRMTYNTTGKRIRTENLASQATVTDWDCCHKVAETQPDGSTTTWDYDDEGRMIAASRLIPLDMTNVTWLTTCYRYDALGRQVATWQTNYAVQVGLPATRTRYDQLGRVIARVDQLGNTTTTEYSPDGRTVFVHNPNTSTRVTTRSASGDTLSITGTAVTPEFHTYGILPDGTRWSRTVQGETASSPRFTKRYENLLGQTILEERSGFQGAVLATTHAYDSLGRRFSISADCNGKKEQKLIETVALRAMMKAKYTTHNIGHYGLAFDYYTHFTSPIRRYPDTMVHRLLTRYQKGGRSASEKKYEELCEHSSDMEILAQQAERDSIKYKMVEFMGKFLGQEYDAHISGITAYGIYCEIDENHCEGMVPMRDLNDDYYDFDERNYCLRGRRRHNIYSLGDSVRIKVARANVEKRQLDFEIVQDMPKQKKK